MGEPSVIVLEFNELSPRLMDRFIAEGHLPNFERFRNESTVAITDPEEPQEKLNPWIQWVTLHTGAPRSEHGIEKLGEAARLEVPSIGEVIAEAGHPVWICGTMNLPSRTAPKGAYLPDPWNPDPEPRPVAFANFNDFVRANVQEHTNASVQMSPRLGARFTWFALRHGLSPKTVAMAGRQLLDERRGGRGRWARASVLDRFQWDLFRWQLRRGRPAFATFFSNSTAHYQHMYWRNLEPEVFTKAPSDEEQERYRHAVLHGYRCMDALVGEAIELADDLGSTLMMCTALSQQPYVQADDRGGKQSWRPRDFDRLLDILGVNDVRGVSPVMAEQFRIHFDSESAARAAVGSMAKATVDGQPLMEALLSGAEVLAGCSVTSTVRDAATVRAPDGRTVAFTDLFYPLETVKSGFHHPDGMWWIRTGVHRAVTGKVSLRSVAPTILSLLDIPPPDGMSEPPLGVGTAA